MKAEGMLQITSDTLFGLNNLSVLLAKINTFSNLEPHTKVGK